jgi:hypothetical protein
MAVKDLEHVSTTKAKTDHDLTTDGGTSKSRLSRLTSAVSNNKKTFTLAGAAAAAAAAGAIAVVKRRKSAALKTTSTELSSSEASLHEEPVAAETSSLRGV